MSDSMFLSVAIFVFVMLAIGLGLTILEFRHGQPSREAKRNAANDDVKGDARLRSPANQSAA